MTKIIHSKGLYKPKIKPKDSFPLDTLAQLVTNENKPDSFEVSACTSVNSKPTLLKRARRKYLGTGLALKLVDSSNQNEYSSLNKGYWNTFHCSGVLTIHDTGKVTGKYCKNRWCMVCNSIRSAQLIGQYQNIVDGWNDKYFVTLTMRSPIGLDLRNVIEGMQYSLTKIRKNFNQKYKRKKCQKFEGFRKLECNYNPITNTYNPHYHFIIRGEDNAKELVDSWLKSYPTLNPKAQQIKKADKNSTLELFKYFTKVITKTKTGERGIYADAMDVIFNAIKGKRIFQNFGFKMEKPKENVIDKNDVGEVVALAIWIQELGDWANEDTGELLSDYIPGEGMKDLVKKIIVRKNFKQY